jgi:hypothetical protein
MFHLVGLAILLALTGLSSFSVAGQLPCTSALCLLPPFSHLFTHCDCFLSEWTEWLAIVRMPVNATQCPSESALVYERWRIVLSGECEDIVEYETTCKLENYGCSVV